MVSQRRRTIIFSGFGMASLLVAGCATGPGAAILNSGSRIWRGRLAVRVDADKNDRLGSSVTAGFELTGNATEGGLTLYTPIGGTAAVLTWSTKQASLLSQSKVRYFSTLQVLIGEVVGTNIPVDALFAWLNGTDASAEGWTADVTDFINGRISAKRTEPSPAAELRIVLEK